VTKRVCLLLIASINALKAQGWRGYEEDRHDSHGGDFWGILTDPVIAIPTIILIVIWLYRDSSTTTESKKSVESKKTKADWFVLLGACCETVFNFLIIYMIAAIPVIIVLIIFKAIFR